VGPTEEDRHCVPPSRPAPHGARHHSTAHLARKPDQVRPQIIAYLEQAPCGISRLPCWAGGADFFTSSLQGFCLSAAGVPRAAARTRGISIARRTAGDFDSEIGNFDLHFGAVAQAIQLHPPPPCRPT